MRPNQNNNNKRSRGRGRKPQGGNPNRSLDSNGPDVKIRGTASHIYEKYIALSRDASLSGDHVASENYQQHAEHYFRLIAAAQAQSRTQNQNQTQNQPVNPGQVSGTRETARLNGGRNGRTQSKPRSDTPQAGQDGQPETAQPETTQPETNASDMGQPAPATRRSRSPRVQSTAPEANQSAPEDAVPSAPEAGAAEPSNGSPADTGEIIGADS